MLGFSTVAVSLIPCLVLHNLTSFFYFTDSMMKGSAAHIFVASTLCPSWVGAIQRVDFCDDHGTSHSIFNFRIISFRYRLNAHSHSGLQVSISTVLGRCTRAYDGVEIFGHASPGRLLSCRRTGIFV
jgi:hypothetical protein